MKENLLVKSMPENSSQVVSFLKKCLEMCNVSPKVAYCICVASEEIFLKIAKYAYKTIGDVSLFCEYDERNHEFSVKFIDKGDYFDPTQASVSSAEEILNKNEFSCFGLFAVKKLIDKIQYNRTENKNELILLQQVQLSNDLQIQSNLDGDVCTVVISGRVDTQTASDLESYIKNVLANNKKIILDFASVSYVSSSGLRVLLLTQKRINQISGELSLKNVTKDVMEILTTTGFTKVLHIV